MSCQEGPLDHLFLLGEGTQKDLKLLQCSHAPMAWPPLGQQSILDNTMAFNKHTCCASKSSCCLLQGHNTLPGEVRVFIAAKVAVRSSLLVPLVPASLQIQCLTVVIMQQRE